MTTNPPTELPQSPRESVEVRYLPSECLYIHTSKQPEEIVREFVPPDTPNSEFGFSDTFKSVPKIFPTLAKLELPYVREKGVKFCIDTLAEYFGCRDYKFNLLQFWFLDVLVDCLWNAQDNFHLPPDEQKVVLSWLLYMIDLIRNPHKNISRRKFFGLFKEAMLMAAEVVDEGCESVPPPEQLFVLEDDEQAKEEEEESETWSLSSSDSDSETSSVSMKSSDFEDISCVELQRAGRSKKYVLPKEVCNCEKYELESIETVSEVASSLRAAKQDQEEVEEEEVEEFYQPDPSVPERFLPLQALEEEQGEAFSDEKGKEEEERSPVEDTQTSIQYISDTSYVHEVKENLLIKQSSEVSSSSRSASVTTTDVIAEEQSEVPVETDLKASHPSLAEKLKEKEVLKELAQYKLWEQRAKDMQNPKVGWVGSKLNIATEEAAEEVAEEEEVSAESVGEDDEEWVDVTLEKEKDKAKADEDRLILNFGVLQAIISSVFKVFFESFQYTVIKMAFQATPDIISQRLNEEWRVPKVSLVELPKPKPAKLPKEKEKKAEKAAKEVKEKPAKPAKEPKPVKEKPKQLTKEEKAELERLRKEEERKQQEMLEVERTKRFVQPLVQAATDDLFNKFFEDWVKPEPGKGKK